MLTLKITSSKRGIPCLWERGGGYSNTGESQIICDKDGYPKKAIYIKRSGELSCLEHALIPINRGDVVIKASHHRRDFEVEVYSILKIQGEEAHLELINSFSKGEWDNENDFWHEALAVEAAVDKATCYHCREAFFIKED